VEGHPSIGLLRLLNEQPVDSRQRLIKQNWDAACVELDRLPWGNSKMLSAGVMQHLAAQHVLVYSAVQGSHRIYARGTNLIQLPRKVRCALLRGAWQHDLASAQLAIVARVWHIPELLEFLEAERNIWTALLEYLDLAPRFKPTLKTVLYRLIFGGGVFKAKQAAVSGEGGDPAIDWEKAERLLEHPLIQALLGARQGVLKRIQVEGGIEDAFGNWHALGEVRGRQIAARCRSLLAMQAQSFEQRIMLSVLPILQAEQASIRPMVWLHDGMVTKTTDASKQERIHRRLDRAVQRSADDLRIPVRLVSEQIN
jgi:hypothetical protein